MKHDIITRRKHGFDTLIILDIMQKIQWHEKSGTRVDLGKVGSNWDRGYPRRLQRKYDKDMKERSWLIILPGVGLNDAVSSIASASTTAIPLIQEKFTISMKTGE